MSHGNVVGVVKLSLPLVREEMVWRGVGGARAMEAFLEDSDVSCEKFRGMVVRARGTRGEVEWVRLIQGNGGICRDEDGAPPLEDNSLKRRPQ